MRNILTAIATCIALSGAVTAQESDKTHAERMAKEHQHDAPTASPAIGGQPSGPIEQQTVVYANVDGQEVRGYLARPPRGVKGAPGLIVIHEWWGLNDNVRAMADQLAGAGYVALAVDLYGGEAASDPEQARAQMQRAMGKVAALEDNLRQAFRYLETQQGADKIGSIGWCFGGGWSLNAALLLPGQLDAAVIYYGRLVTEPARLSALTAPILGLFGAQDQGIPVAAVHEFEAALKALGKPAEIHIYPDAGHAFANPSGTRYQREAADDAWGKTLAFLAQHLRS